MRPLDRLLPVEGDDDDPDVDVDGEDDHEHDEGDTGVAQVIVDLCVREKQPVSATSTLGNRPGQNKQGLKNMFL